MITCAAATLRSGRGDHLLPSPGALDHDAAAMTPADPVPGRPDHGAGRAPPTRLGVAAADGGIVGTSHRLHRPRGGWCARGYCQQCPLTDGRLACETPADDGDARFSTVRIVDPVRPLAWYGGRMEPWFYETRFLRPAVARPAALEVLRRLSAAAALPRRAAAPGRSPRAIDVDVAVVGGGPAGVAAAAEAARTGTPVAVVTRAELGGSLPLEPGVRDRADADAAALRGSTDVAVFVRTTCVGWYEGEGILAASSPEGPLAMRPRRIIVATGAYDRPLLVPGADLPGVVGLRGFQLLASQGVFRESTVGVVGAGEELRRARATADAFGIAVGWVVAGDDVASAPRRARLGSIAGRRRARGVTLDDGTDLDADLVVIATTQPTYELQLQLGATPTFEGSPPVIRAWGPMTLPTLVVGEAAGWRDAAGTSDRAAAATAAWLGGHDPATGDPSPHAELASGPAPAGVVCVCEDVRHRDVDRAVAEGFGDVELVKRRSGASTGACQGKLCLALLAESFEACGAEPSLTTVRPPIRPTRIGDLGGVRG